MKTKNLALPLPILAVLALLASGLTAQPTKRIHVVYEKPADPYATDEEIDDGTIFVLLHELGHALIDLFDIPITGREEDAVDGLATLILLEDGDEEAALAAADHFDLMALEMEEAGDELAFWDEHSLNEQRVYDIVCLVYGSNPQAFADLADPEFLPPARARRCPAEYEQKSEAWTKLLGPYLVW